MNFRDQLSLSFVSQLVRTPKGRAHILNQVALAESSGEARMFDHLLSRVDDTQLAKMVTRHRDDEIRHEQLFTACLRRTGVDPGPVPAHLRIMDRLDRNLDGFLGRPIVDDRGVMEAYLVLQALEERAVHQFAIMEQAFRNVDPETADTFVEVGRDENRHLRYCQAISKRYAPSEKVRVERLEFMRDVEAHTFQDANFANMEYTLEHGLVPGAFRRAAWRIVGSLAARAGSLPRTRFARADDIQPLLMAA